MEYYVIIIMIVVFVSISFYLTSEYYRIDKMSQSLEKQKEELNKRESELVARENRNNNNEKEIQEQLNYLKIENAKLDKKKADFIIFD